MDFGLNCLSLNKNALIHAYGIFFKNVGNQ